jgi:hypothetical protein
MPSEVRILEGGERFRGTDLVVSSFWQWAMGDLRMNNTRGLLAEWLVARAIGAPAPVRVEWDNYDVVAPDGTTIEVKTSGYLQSWEQERQSDIRFGGLRSRRWDAESKTRGTETTVACDVIAFAVHACGDPAAYDALDIAQWEFYVAAGSEIDALRQQSAVLSTIARIAQGPAPYADLGNLIKAAAQIHHATTTLPAADNATGERHG